MHRFWGLGCDIFVGEIIILPTTRRCKHGYIHSFHKHLLSANCMPSCSSAGDTARNKVHNTLDFMEHSERGNTINEADTISDVGCQGGSAWERG